MIRDVKKLMPQVTYPFVSFPNDVVLCVLSDVSHPTDRNYSQARLIAGIPSRTGRKGNEFIHVID